MAVATAATTTLTHDSANQLTSSSQSPTGQTVAYTHDVRGNRTRAQDSLGNRTRFTWNQANQLVRYSGPAPAAAREEIGPSYFYDGDGLLTDLTWDRAQGLPLPIADLVNYYVTGPRGTPIEKIDYAGNVLYYHADQLGSTRALTDAGGRPVVTYAYDPYGSATPSGTEVLNPFQFAGQYTDVQTGLIYMRARWYDPATGQFISRDPRVSESGQPYAYANNSPHNFTDPTGEIAWLAGAAVVLGVIELGSAVVDAVSTAKTFADPCASGLDKLISGGLFAAGVGQPGGGYSTAARAAGDKIGDAGRRVWSITGEGTARALRHDRFGTFSKSHSDGLWWVRDRAGHGGSVWKVYEETSTGLRWRADADMYGDFISGKHKGPVGQFIPWKELTG